MNTSLIAVHPSTKIVKVWLISVSTKKILDRKLDGLSIQQAMANVHEIVKEVSKEQQLSSTQEDLTGPNMYPIQNVWVLW